jgi:carboxymethylenebutenolidase
MSITNQESEKSLLLPSAPIIQVAPSVTIQPPLSRVGKGPGLIILVEHESATKASTESIDPPPLQKWAEESFVVGQIDLSKLEKGFEDTLSDTLQSIKELDSFDRNVKFGLICKSSLKGVLMWY